MTDKNTVEIDIKDLQEIMSHADAYKDIIDSEALILTTSDVQYILDEEAFDHNEFTVERSQFQWDNELEDMITESRNATS